jgi:NAD(P)-dependent dehydrogenase (short-subunit alcohol dehydrogenase family)
MRTIHDKIALVTGAGSGLGRAIALRLAQEGAHLHLADINASAAEATAAQIRALSSRHTPCAVSPKVAVTTCDLCDPASLDSLVTAVHDRWGGLDILVNNAGIAWYGPTQKMTDDEWDKLLTLNLHVPIRLTTRFLKTLLSRPESHVINMASICGFVCGGRFNAYHVSKSGLVGFSEALRAEFNRHGLGVTALCPGPVLTDLYKSSGCGYADRETPHPPAWLCTTADRVAAKTIRAIYGNHAISLVGLAAHLLYYSKRLAPSIFYALHQIGRTKNLRRKSRPMVPIGQASRSASKQNRKAA